jgi:hypothetical protein
MEILRAYAEAYPQGAHSLTLISTAITASQRSGLDVRSDQLLLGRLHGHLLELVRHCDHLPVTRIAINDLLKIISRPEYMDQWDEPEIVLLSCISDIQGRLRDELSINLFFNLPHEKKKYFDAPCTGWEDALRRFPDALLDVEEMSRCFALSRYAASVFHSVAVIEVGLLHLGGFVSVNDPHSGWTAVTGRLQKIVDTKYASLSDSEKEHRPFLEQMHAVTQSLKSAWRNKISHAQGKLLVMTSEFSPDIAEEIMISSRSFMRRLATEMPEGSL